MHTAVGHVFNLGCSVWEVCLHVDEKGGMTPVGKIDKHLEAQILYPYRVRLMPARRDHGAGTFPVSVILVLRKVLPLSPRLPLVS